MTNNWYKTKFLDNYNKHSIIKLIIILILFSAAVNLVLKKGSIRLSECDCKQAFRDYVMDNKPDRWVKCMRDYNKELDNFVKKSTSSLLPDKSGSLDGAWQSLAVGYFENICNDTNSFKNSTFSSDSMPPNEFPIELIGDYYGTSMMGNLIGEAKISISKNGKICVSYNHGNLGNAIEYGNLSTTSKQLGDAEELSYKFYKDNGGDYDIKIIKSKNEIKVILIGVNWNVTTIRKINSEDSKILINQTEDSIIPQNSESEIYTKDTEINDEEINHPLGKLFITNGSLEHKVFFYNSPDLSTRRTAYFDNHEKVKAFKIKNGFVYVEFTNSRGITSIGWLKLEDLIEAP